MNTNEFVQKVQMAILAVFFVVVMSSAGWAATYYVDATNGNDSNTGSSEAAPWKTIAKVNASNFNPGDFILFKRGEVWREQLIISSNGDSKNPIRFAAYGKGERPKINGSTLLTGWAEESNSNKCWYSDISSEPNAVFINNVLGHKEISKQNIDSEYDWWYGENKLYIYAPSNPNTTYTAPGIEAVQRDGIYSQRKSHITIENIDIYRAKYGIQFKWATTEDINLQSLSIHSTDKAIYFSTASNLTIKDCLINNVYTYHGIHFYQCSNILVENNYFYDTTREAVKLEKSYDGNLLRNRVYRPSQKYDTGGFLFADCKGNHLIAYNLIVDSGNQDYSAHGVFLHNTSNVQIFNNTIYNASGDGFRIEEGSDACEICNNVVHTVGSLYVIRGGDFGWERISTNNNSYFNNSNPLYFMWGGDQLTMSQWQTSFSQDMASISDDPKLGPDLKIARSSPCVDKGKILPFTKDIVNNNVPAGPLPDIGAYEVQVSVTLEPPKNFSILSK